MIQLLSSILLEVILRQNNNYFKEIWNINFSTYLVPIMAPYEIYYNFINKDKYFF